MQAFGFRPMGKSECPELYSIFFDTFVRLTKDGTLIRQQSNVLEQLRQLHGFGMTCCLRADLVNLLLASLSKHDTKVQLFTQTH